MSPGDTLGAILLPSLSSPPGPTASTFASLSSFKLLSGKIIPPAVLVSAFTLWTRMRSRRGARDFIDLRAVAWEQNWLAEVKIFECYRREYHDASIFNF